MFKQYKVENFINSVALFLSSDHEFIEEQERYLFATSIRTMALPVGR